MDANQQMPKQKLKVWSDNVDTALDGAARYPTYWKLQCFPIMTTMLLFQIREQHLMHLWQWITLNQPMPDKSNYEVHDFMGQLAKIENETYGSSRSN